MAQKIRKERITKREFYERGGFSNSDLFRLQSRGGAWRYCHSEPVGREAEIARQAFAMAIALRDEARAMVADYNSPARVKARNLRKMAPELLDAVTLCVKAEKERQRKLKPGSPASTYAGERIERLEALIIKALAG